MRVVDVEVDAVFQRKFPAGFGHDRPDTTVFRVGLDESEFLEIGEVAAFFFADLFEEREVIGALIGRPRQSRTNRVRQTSTKPSANISYN